MAGTQQSATVFITNGSGGNAWILLSHNNTSNGTQTGSWQAAPGQTVGPLTVYFETGPGTELIFDYWSALLHVQDGAAPGFYVSDGSLLHPYQQECQLQSADAGQTLTFTVGTTSFDVALDSRGHTDGMTKLLPASPVTHVFVLMLENHSFDNVFAMSGIAGITAATTSDSNAYAGTTYPVQASAPLSMPTDPGHEFPDVVEQLAGQGKSFPPGGPYPAIDNSGFAANYATSTTEGAAPPAADIGDVMACFATPTQLPVIYALATAFALCDQWFSSLPGPTWPNRFFVHGASSSGLDASPTTEQIVEWETVSGFKYPNGSIYQSLSNAGIPYRFYNDSGPGDLSLYSDDPASGSPAGAVPQVSALSGVTLTAINSLSHLASDLQGPYPYPYTFIEPHYGDIVSGTYAGGSSQHPMDDVYGGENLLAAVYAAIRSSPYWNSSLLIVTYDEHGGLYDVVAPGPAPAPGDDPKYGYNKYGFDFRTYGVRVPAVVASPLIPAGTVDHTLHDHASVLSTIEALFGLPALTKRDAAAIGVQSLLSLSAPRTDCPATLGSPAPLLKAATPPLTPQERALRDAQPLPTSGNLVGALQNLKKTELELAGSTPQEAAAINARFAALSTRGDARAYVASVMEKVRIAREQQKQAGLRTP